MHRASPSKALQIHAKLRYHLYGEGEPTGLALGAPAAGAAGATGAAGGVGAAAVPGAGEAAAEGGGGGANAGEEPEPTGSQ